MRNWKTPLPVWQCECGHQDCIGSIEELKEKNNSLSQEVQNAQHQREELERENNHLKEQQNGWQERLQALLGRMEEV